MHSAPRLRQPSIQNTVKDSDKSITSLVSSGSSPPTSSSMDSGSITRVKNRIVSTPGVPTVPFGNISNRFHSNSTDDTMNRQHVGRKPSRTMAASEGMIGHENEEMRPPRTIPRTSITGRRSFSGAKGASSALRRLPPGVTSRSVMPSLNANDDSYMDRQASSSSTTSKPAVAALARVHQGNGPRRSLGVSINAAANAGIAQHEREVREVVKLNVDSTNFEEWMKMATDNKINATNTWNFALIDYFHDMSLLRSDTGDGTINFQKASCTLDGCVKVWTSRVDSVVVETGKLLSGLQDEGKDSNSKSRRGKGGANDDDEDGVDEEDENGTAAKKKKSRAKEPTLAKSFSQLAVKKLDLEFTVDPLFKKTSADFDEGGAGGLLMNHLGVDSNARVVFDAGDVAGVGDDEEMEEQLLASIEEEEEEGEGDPDREKNSDAMQATTAAFEDQVDLFKLRGKLFPELLGEEEDGNDILDRLLEDLVICPTFASFKFAPGDDTPFTAITSAGEAETTPQQYAVDAMPGLVEEEEDFFNDMPAYDNDGLEDAFGEVDAFGGGGAAAAAGVAGGANIGYDYDDQEGDDGAIGITRGATMIPTNAPIDFTSAFQGITDEHGVKMNGDDFFDYFDQRLAKNWAGPEHWKMRNVGMGAPPGQRNDIVNGVAAERVAKKSKEPFVVDFSSPEAAVSAKQLFEVAKGGGGTTLPQQKDASHLETYLLPEDQHFNSRRLLRLFIKPRAMLNLKRKGVAVVTSDPLDGKSHPADVDEAYWAKAAAAREASRELGTESEYADAEGGGMPFNTQFYHDAEDDGAFDAMDDGPDGMLGLDIHGDDAELATQALKRIRPEFVNYAKKAKRVDVRKLKENIWKELAIAIGKSSSGSDEDDDDDGDGDEEIEEIEDEMADRSATPKATKRAARLSESLQPKVFNSVLSGLRKAYPKDRMEEISTSFCFICLLHLANEEGLDIQTATKPPPQNRGGFLDRLAEVGDVVGDDEDDDALGEDDGDMKGEARVGFLEQLSIAKDPTAGRSA
ncbi:hypothetical protein CBS101457_002019 [Exobasidium rhododendri]|nr:hypothetical protein CBS101457_002019 [Exobasidium rhododendri]